jgi:hypothetical protein
LHILPATYSPAPTASVWLPSSPPSRASLAPASIALLASALRPFLFARLPRLLALLAADVPWNFTPLCRGCPFEPVHRARALDEGALGAMPNLSVADQEALRGLLGLARARFPLGADASDIEDLHLLFKDASNVDALEREFPSSVKKAKRILRVPARARRTLSAPSPYPKYKGKDKSKDDIAATDTPSALVEAARTRTAQLIPRRNFSLPAHEDLALFLSLVLDPATDRVARFSLAVFARAPELALGDPRLQNQAGGADALVHALAAALRAVLALEPAVRAQTYVFSGAERAALQRHLVDAALSSATQTETDAKAAADVRLCVGALCEGAALLATAIQPPVLSGALLDFLRRKGGLSKGELRACLGRIGADAEGTVDELRARLEGEIERLKRLGGRGGASEGAEEETRGGKRAGERPTVGELPRVVVLKREIERLVALPVPGYWELPECAAALLGAAAGGACPSDDAICEAHAAARADTAAALLAARNRTMRLVLREVRARVQSAGGGLLVNAARPLTADFMDLCEQPHIRKLFYMQQVRRLARRTTRHGT